MEILSRQIQETALLEGAVAAGIATVRTLAGGPPSTDLTYVLEGAEAAVSFAVPLQQGDIAPYLQKQDRLALEKDFIRANVAASGIALHVANYLTNSGYPSAPVAANLMYRQGDDISDVSAELPKNDGFVAYDPTAIVHPDLAHRFLAVRAGLGHLGRSGNFIMPEYGAAVILGAVVTTAPLSPTPPLPAEENYCDDCRLCLASCAASFMDFSRDVRITLGGEEFTYARRRNYARCDLVCSGYTGLAPSGKWSTWSPGRFRIPDKTKDIPKAYERIVGAYAKWPESPGGRRFYYTEQKLRVSCAHCQLICAPELSERKARHKMLKQSGVIVQDESGALHAVPPEEAERRLAEMSQQRRALYQD